MSYLQDRKLRNKSMKKVIIGIAVLFVLFYFHSQIFGAFSKITHAIFTPIINLGNNIGDGISHSGSFLKSKKGLTIRNQELLEQIAKYEAEMANYNTVLLENMSLKESLDRSIGSDFILGSILSKPNKSPYDTLIIDLGEKDGIMIGDEVFALGNIPIGMIEQVFSDTSKVVLYSTPSFKKEVIVGDGNNYLEIEGRGGGNFEINIPRDMELPVGTEAVLPGIFPYTIARVETIISDPRDSFVKALLVSPVNIQELKFVEVKK